MKLPIVIDHGSPAYRAVQLGGFALAALVVWLMWSTSDFRVGQFTSVLIMAIAVSGLNVVTGYSGLLSIGHSAFYGIGAYTTGILIQRGWGPVSTFPVAMVLCFVVGVIVGIPALRIRGHYLALVTLALGIAFPELIRRFSDLTGGAKGLVIRSREIAPPEWTGFGVAERQRYLFWVALSLLILVVVALRSLTRSRWGLGMVAARDSEVAAAAYGVHLAEVRTVAFGFSGAITGLAGSILAVSLGTLSPDGSFTLLKSIEFLTGLVIGGAATLAGPLVGAIVVVFLPYYSARFFSGQLAAIMFGVVLIFMVFVMPQGIVGAFYAQARKVLIIRPSYQLRADRRAQTIGSSPELVSGAAER